MTGLINPFDLIILILIVVSNYLHFSKRLIIPFNWIVVAVILLLFTIPLPYLSTKIEVMLVRATHDVNALDGFNLA